jgi:hypothetical protein
MEKKNKTLVVFLIIGFIFVFGLGIFAATSLTQQPDVRQIQNVFSDVNGDGKLDLILDAKVILNVDSLDFPLSQPEQQNQ